MVVLQIKQINPFLRETGPSNLPGLGMFRLCVCLVLSVTLDLPFLSMQLFLCTSVGLCGADWHRPISLFLHHGLKPFCDALRQS